MNSDVRFSCVCFLLREATGICSEVRQLVESGKNGLLLGLSQSYLSEQGRALINYVRSVFRANMRRAGVRDDLSS